MFSHFWARVKKTTAIYEMSTLKVVKFEKFAKKQQYLNFGPKMPYWAFFLPGVPHLGFFELKI